VCVFVVICKWYLFACACEYLLLYVHLWFCVHMTVHTPTDSKRCNFTWQQTVHAKQCTHKKSLPTLNLQIYVCSVLDSSCIAAHVAVCGNLHWLLSLNPGVLCICIGVHLKLILFLPSSYFLSCACD